MVAGAFPSWFFSLTQQREPTKKKYTHRNHHSLDNSTVRKRNSEQHFHITANRQVESSGHLIFAHWQVHASGRQIRNLLRATGLALLLQMLPNAVDCCTLGGEGIGRRRENLPNESQSKSFYHSYQLPFLLRIDVAWCVFGYRASYWLAETVLPRLWKLSLCWVEDSTYWVRVRIVYAMEFLYDSSLKPSC